MTAAERAPPDGDNDGSPNACDNCNGLANPTQSDADADGAVNCLDQCPNTAACAVVVDPEYRCPWYDCDEYELGCDPALADIDYFVQMLLEEGYDCLFDLSGEEGYPDGVINGWDMQSYVRALLNQ